MNRSISTNTAAWPLRKRPTFVASWRKSKAMHENCVIGRRTWKLNYCRSRPLRGRRQPRRRAMSWAWMSQTYRLRTPVIAILSQRYWTILHVWLVTFERPPRMLHLYPDEGRALIAVRPLKKAQMAVADEILDLLRR